MKTLKGKPTGRFKPIIGLATRESVPFHQRHDKIYVGEKPSLGYRGYVTLTESFGIFTPDGISGIDTANIQSGDILKLHDDGLIEFLWEEGSYQNVFFLTSRCDCACVMCPQPGIAHDHIHFEEALKVLRLLKGRNVEALCISGGEPALDKAKFLEFLEKCRRQFPNAPLDILTNGRAFADMEFVKALRGIAPAGARFCVSIHGDTPMIHDRITGVSGSFGQTSMGIYNLWQKGFRLELRTVISGLNVGRLPQIAQHFLDFFPFCEHYAFMGLEMCHKAWDNRERLDIDYAAYKTKIAKACSILDRACLNVSIYNIPLCMCDEKARKFAAKSISDWKNIFPDECYMCSMKHDCCGFFETSTSIHKESIKLF